MSLLLCCWKRVFAMTSAFSWQNSVSLCPASFCTPRPKCLLLPVFLDFLLLYSSPLAPHSSTLAWKIPWTEEPGGLQFMGSLRVGHDWATSLSLSICLYNYAIIYNCICICICETNSKYFNHFSKFPWALCNPPSLYSHPQETTNLISVTIIWIFWNVI